MAADSEPDRPADVFHPRTRRLDYADALRDYIGGVLLVPERRLGAVRIGPRARDCSGLGSGEDILRALHDAAGAPWGDLDAVLSRPDAEHYMDAAREAGLLDDDTTPPSLADARHWQRAVFALDGALRVGLGRAADELARDVAEHWDTSGGRAYPTRSVAKACEPVLDLLERQPAAFRRLAQLVDNVQVPVPSTGPLPKSPKLLARTMGRLARDEGLGMLSRFAEAEILLGGYREQLGGSDPAPARGRARWTAIAASAKSALSTVFGGGWAQEQSEIAAKPPGGPRQPKPPRRSP